ncbi:DDX19B isoform 2 [Pongo abelii]|uniref:DDX19B isoform 2 n=1 Tax=Pongo abelii TaxID=9601 RepID=A0A2J8VW59_PONAB|nr:DDX19B isoform 2 [Pongo abelii]
MATDSWALAVDEQEAAAESRTELPSPYSTN